MSLIGKLFQHYFNGKYYRVICEAYCLGTKEKIIVYRKEFDDSRIYGLSERKFKRIIKINNLKLHKFKEIKE